jgi:hypothetical protein
MNLKKMADAAARRYGIPPSLFRRLIQQESGWNPDARNPSGATGLVQIHLPSHPDISEAQARDPAFALGWGARYLAAQKARFGRWDLALAAYNAGPGNVESGKWQSFPETRNYVRSILAGASTKAAPVLPAPPVARAPKLGVPAAQNPGLLASLLQSNNDMIGIGTPAPLLDLLTKAQQPAAIPNFGGLAPKPEKHDHSVPLQSSPSVTGFVPAFQAALDKLLKATGLTVTSGYRSNERQAELFAAAVRKYGSEAAARKWVAPPGKSKHNHGVAADLGGNLSVLNDALLRKYGLYRPMQWEPWHVELIGSRG